MKGLFPSFFCLFLYFFNYFATFLLHCAFIIVYLHKQLNKTIMTTKESLNQAKTKIEEAIKLIKNAYNENENKEGKATHDHVALEIEKLSIYLSE